jgi:hypothetical protein
MIEQKIDSCKIDELVNTYLSINNMRYVDLDEPTHELCEFYAENNMPEIIFNGGQTKMMVYRNHVEVTNEHECDYYIDIYIRR